MFLLDAFDYDLPLDAIADTPKQKRSDARLLCLSPSGASEHRFFFQFPELLTSNDLLIANNTQVLPARLKGRKPTGGQVEIFLEKLLGERLALVQIKSSKPLSAGMRIQLLDSEVLLQEKLEAFWRVEFSEAAISVFQRLGQTPLPPYIKRTPTAEDEQRYQTLFAKHPGAVAAPTAGLHFDEQVLEQIRAKNIDMEFVTLHVGAGTFKPIQVADVREHQMHSEWVSVSNTVIEKIRATKARGGRVIAIGTTALRALETAGLNAYEGETRLFIYPGFQFQNVDALVTNFHLPKSSLLVLVSAFAGREKILAAYQEALAEGYQFFSYGDAMFLTRGEA